MIWAFKLTCTYYLHVYNIWQKYTETVLMKRAWQNPWIKALGCTASIKPRLLFSHAGYASSGLSLCLVETDLVCNIGESCQIGHRPEASYYILTNAFFPWKQSLEGTILESFCWSVSGLLVCLHVMLQVCGEKILLHFLKWNFTCYFTNIFVDWDPNKNMTFLL